MMIKYFYIKQIYSYVMTVCIYADIMTVCIYADISNEEISHFGLYQVFQ